MICAPREVGLVRVFLQVSAAQRGTSGCGQLSRTRRPRDHHNSAGAGLIAMTAGEIRPAAHRHDPSAASRRALPAMVTLATAPPGPGPASPLPAPAHNSAAADVVLASRRLRSRRPGSGRHDVPGSVPPHPGIRVTVDQRRVIPPPDPSRRPVRPRHYPQRRRPVPRRPDARRNGPSAR